MSERKQLALEKAKLEMLKRSVVWKNVFGTEEGQKCLALLKEQFYDVPTIAVKEPSETLIRAAQRDLVRYIIDQVELTGEENEI